MGHALELALGGHANLIQGIDQTEPLIEWIAGQLTTEPAIILLQQGPQERAAQGPPRALLELQLFQGRDGSRCPGGPAFQGALHKVPLHPAGAQKGIDLFQALTQGEAVNVPDDGGQLRAKFLREGNNLRGHDASV